MVDTVIILGGTTYTVPPLSIFALETCGENISRVGTTTHAVTQCREIATVMSVAMTFSEGHPKIDDILRGMTIMDYPAMVRGFSELLKNSGMIPEEGETPGESQVPAQ